jgi:hypothetical protein
VSIKHRMRRALGVGLAGAMVLALMPAGIATADGHSDVCANVPEQDDFQDQASISATFREYVDCMQAYGIAAGFPDGTYRPGNPVTRQQMALFIARFISQAEDGDTTIPPTAPSTYTDRMHATPEARAAIDWLTERGVVQGFADNTYRPGANVTRAQMASFIAQAMEEVGADLDEGDGDNYPDVDDNATHSDNINKLTEAGVVRGFTDGTYRPGANVTRQQMAQFIILARPSSTSRTSGRASSSRKRLPRPTATVTERPELVSATIVQTTEPGHDHPLHVRRGPHRRVRRAEQLPHLHLRFRRCERSFRRQPGGRRHREHPDGPGDLPWNHDRERCCRSLRGDGGEGAVRGVTGLPGDGNTEGDAPLNPGTTTQLQARTTAAPDLVSVGNFRLNVASPTQTLVDFTFDAAADNANRDRVQPRPGRRRRVVLRHRRRWRRHDRAHRRLQQHHHPGHGHPAGLWLRSRICRPWHREPGRGGDRSGQPAPGAQHHGRC